MPRLSKIGAACLAAFGWTGGQTVSASYLQVAGGGGGGFVSGSNRGAGGGAGGFLTGSFSLNPTQSYTVTVGAGGTPFANGNNSTITGTGISITASVGGGAGGSQNGAGATAGANGGSGGGGPSQSGTGSNAAGTGTSGQGNAGAAGTNAGGQPFGCGGGGGAGAVGTLNNNPAGAGGVGLANPISGSTSGELSGGIYYLAGGGGGGTYAAGGGVGGAGGLGGGGLGGGTTSANGVSGTANTGGGGGGAEYSSSAGASGGSGIVIISYVGAQQFGGGVVTSSGGSTIHTFTTSGTLSPLSSLTASALIVAGGGGGGSGVFSPGTSGGGGGAGGLQTSSGLTIDTNSIYVVTVGAGGTAGSGGAGGSGTSSIFLATTSAGGGGGGAGASNGATGGSGGGGAGGGSATNGGAGNTPSTSPSQGNNGSNGNSSPDYGGGGGGGASAVGGTSSGGTAGAGGAGTANSISGSSVTYAGGGGGGIQSGSTAGVGGAGGGGAGGVAVAGTAGTVNLGGGGGGGGYSAGAGGAGGSGVVIISYSGSVQLMAGGTVTISGGNVIHTFTSSGYLTPIVLVTNSLRFRSSASAYLNRTPTVASNQKTWTWSAWVKRGSLGSTVQILHCYDGASSRRSSIQFNSDNTIGWDQGGSGTSGLIDTVAVYRDPSAWYHLVCVADYSNGIPANRALIYINGVLQTVTTADDFDNADGLINSTNAHQIASQGGTGNFFDGYMTEINFIDGQALTPSSFGTTSDLGVWQPIRYGGSYGTNGFYLKFTDTTSTSTLGTDFSGNSNTWTVNGISLTSGSTYDSMNDVPTLTSATTANYSVINPLQNGGLTITNGNLTWAGAGSSTKCATASIAMTSGKWYFEALITGSSGGNWYAGVCNLSPTLTSAPSATATGWGLVTGGGGTVLYKSNNNVLTSLSSSSVTGSVVSFAIDVDAGKIWFAQNGTWLEGSPSAGTGASYTNLTGTQVPFVAGYDSNDQGSINFGQRPFAYTPPTGFVALNTFNLPTPTIGATASTTANKYFDATLYTATTGTNTIVNAGGFQPDFVWTKSRSNPQNHYLVDSVRGGTSLLQSNITNAESIYSTPAWIISFNSNGFTSSTDSLLTTGYTYVGWQWRASNATAVTNTAGSITSTVSANTTAGFSIVTYTGTGANATVGHGLGATPSMIIVKNRDSSAIGGAVYHTSMGATKYLKLFQTTTGSDGEATDNTAWNGSSPTFDPSVFSVGSLNRTNSSQQMVAYCFAPVAGYSAFGSYTGNGSTDGAFIFTGFRPRYLMIKSTSVESWELFDTSRSPYNQAVALLEADSSGAENTSSTSAIDILSNGFKQRNTRAATNGSGTTYIYMAFAENPFKYANAR